MSDPDLVGPSAAVLWNVHRDALHGASAYTGELLPEDLSSRRSTVQAAHHAMACFCALVCGAQPPAPPESLSDGEAERALMLGRSWADRELDRRAQMMGEGHLVDAAPDTGRMTVDPADEDHPEGFPNPGAGFCRGLNIKAEAGSY
jgi:hypothetical protein